jgi:hypothetical protein
VQEHLRDVAEGLRQDQLAILLAVEHLGFVVDGITAQGDERSGTRNGCAPRKLSGNITKQVAPEPSPEPAPEPESTPTDTAPTDAVGSTDPAPVAPAPTAEPYSEPTPEPTSQSEPQLIPDSATNLTDPGPATPLTEEDVAASVAQLVDDLLESYSEQVADVVEQVTDAVELISEALGGLMGGDWTPGPTEDLIEQVGNAVANIAQATGGAFSAEGVSNQADEAFTPPIVPAPTVPVAPGAPAPASSSSFLSTSWSSTDTFQLLFAVLLLFSVALLQGGKLLWRHCDALGPRSVLQLAVERPG